MQEVTVKFPLRQDRGYKIYVGTDLIRKIGSLYDLGAYSNVFVVADDNVQPVLEQLLTALPAGTTSLKLPSGEAHKNIESAVKIWKAMHEAGCDRKSLVINLGGGVICDVGAFAASTYMRGVSFLNVPTTLLAQADASVGGKTGFNFAGIKNLLGTFDQPVGVVADTRTLDTLSDREFVSGFGEIIKHGAICDKGYFEKVTSKHPREFSQDELADIVALSCRIKADMVQVDETESGARKLLNFGHTIGHAVEALSQETGKPLLHGEAISVGIVAEADISLRLKMLPADDYKRLRQALAEAGLPVSVGGISIDSVLSKMRSDKKNERGEFNFTLLEAIGKARYDQHVDIAVLTESIETIIDR